ncbi:uncharacterized protein Tco025E_05473 [Trypanosoma conorhini]|uniref:Uncharacterized protein n=1 Tax=Trypanosoma conorhini TaxID=83891 RepID=A0A3R7MIA7_9TRYP|nr:uncharacterized protein Tco025E_05473 [Trypanosoma conorhini]RNF15609.1 hypothetical protein Tco025E_05473 [Trypanosoma conorhini]
MLSTAPPRHWGANETRSLLFDGGGLQGQLLSGLSLLALDGGSDAPHTADSPEPWRLRLMMHFMEVASKYPVLGTLLLECPRSLDDVLGEELMQWLREESALILSPSSQHHMAPGSLCHHVSAEALASMEFASAADSGCPICAWTAQWSCDFWEAVKKGTVKLVVCCALSAFPSCLTLHQKRSPFQRPRDAVIAAEQWIHAIGHVTGVFFPHRESADPAPVLEFQPLLSNHNGMVGQLPLWLDLSLLPLTELRAVAVVGERIQVLGLLEVACGQMGPMLYSRRRCVPAAAAVPSSTASAGHILIEARAVRTATFASPWSQDFFMARADAANYPSFSLGVEDVFAVRQEWEEASFLQSRCSWESVAGAAAFALAEGCGGIFREEEPGGPCRVEALLAASRVFALPAALWAAVGVALVSATVQVDSIAAYVVGPSDSLFVLQKFLLALASETNVVVPLVHGVEGALLPTYTRIATSQVGIPVTVEVGRHIECVRGGLLNVASQRVLFAPSLHTLTASALHAVQGVIKQHEHVVVREGGQRVGCRAAGAFIGATQESVLVQDRQLFCFMERGDVVIHLPPTTPIGRVESDHSAILELLSNNAAGNERSELDGLDHMCRCKNQWLAWCEWALQPSVDEPIIPHISTPCAALLRSFFFTAKATCAEAVDASMMTILVKLTCAHALLRQRLHPSGAHGDTQAAVALACACGVKVKEAADSTALVDAVAAIALCDASLKFIAGVSLMGEPCTFDLMLSDAQFDVVQFAKELYAHLLSHTPASSM